MVGRSVRIEIIEDFKDLQDWKDATHRHVIADLTRLFIGTRMMKNEVLPR